MNFSIVPRNQRNWAGWRAISLALVLLSGCGHDHKAKHPPEEMAPETQEQIPEYQPPARIAPTPTPPGGVSAEDLDYVTTHRPILTEVGLATWYTAAKGRKSANGELFSDRDLTAAHRTLPMGSLIVVTNMKTGQSSPLRITDRGPFVEGRIIDLTIASAKATGVYRAGLVEVRVDVYKTPKPIHTGGRWCVQIGAFHSEREADRLKEQLIRKYPGANVIEFPGEDSYWVRIRPEDDNREEAESIARHVIPSEGEAFLTRLD
jgi:rare lipoprotein A